MLQSQLCQHSDMRVLPQAGGAETVLTTRTQVRELVLSGQNRSCMHPASSSLPEPFKHQPGHLLLNEFAHSTGSS